MLKYIFILKKESQKFMKIIHIKTIILFMILLIIITILLSIGSTAKDNVTIGAREVEATALNKGQIFASPTANKNNKTCTKQQPCTLENAIILLNENREHKNILFLRGGIYKLNEIIENKQFINTSSANKKLKKCHKKCHSCPKSYKADKHLTIKRSGTALNPIIIESYPNEWAILDGGNNSVDDVKNERSMVAMGFEINRNIKEQKNISFVYIRRLEIKGVRTYGVRIRGDHNKVEGCRIHHNFLEGISIAPKNFKKLHKQTSFNKILDNRVFNNSDAVLTCREGPNDYDQGEEADGISITAGEYNIINHNEVYNNSDDGIDTFNSNYSKVQYNLVHHNGLGKKGNGNGIKAGGCNAIAEKAKRCSHLKVGLQTLSTHNISYENKKSGFASNSGTNPIFKFNTAYKNGKYGFHVDEKSILESNIAYENQLPPKKILPAIHKNNSWQKKNKNSTDFASVVPASENFMKLKNSAVALGAYAKEP